MSDFVYGGDGEPRGFRLGNYLYDLTGRAIARVSAERVYRLDGTYVGEMYRGRVVQKPVGARRNLPPVPRPADSPVPPPDTSRGSVTDEGFPDLFDRLSPDPP